jgi:hypothetical protein
MIKIIAFICALPIFFQDDKRPIDPVVRMFELEGSITFTSFSQGGAPRPDDLMNNEYPKSKFNMYIVEYFGDDIPSKVVRKLLTNEKGIFKVGLKPGKYGFVLSNKDIEPGQYLPVGYENRSEHYTESSSWTISTDGPIEIKDKNVKGLKIVNHQRSICLDCP